MCYAFIAMEQERDDSKRPRTRTRQTDFHRIENPLQGTELSGYELEVREKLAEGLSPLDRMVAEEEALEKRKADIQIRRWIHRNRKYAGLTPKQGVCYRLWESRYSEDSKKKVSLKKVAQNWESVPQAYPPASRESREGWSN